MKFVKILLALVVLGGIAFGVWYYLNPEAEIPFMRNTYPESVAELRDEVSIEFSDKGHVILMGSNREDVYYMQGYHHGRKYGKKLDALRRLFEGEKTNDVYPDVRGLAELFYYLDLKTLSAKCAERYPQQVLTMIKSYAAGLDAGNGEERPWTLDDVFMFQRAYAFLMGHNFSKEWALQRLLQHYPAEEFAEISTYMPKDFGAFAQNLTLSPSLNVLLAKPMIEHVRLYEGRGQMGAQTRTHPFFAWVIEPTVLTVHGVYEARGYAMVGQPFLYSGQTDNLTFFRQPILANDDQVTAVPEGSFGDPRDPRVLINNDAANVGEYQEPPKHTPLGRKVNALLGGTGSKDHYYNWDGFRPSADLAASYYLLEAGSIDSAINAFAYQQVPASELTLMTKRGHTVNMVSYPTDPRVDKTPKLFSKPYTRIGRPISNVSGLHFRGEAPWTAKRSSRTGQSELDDRLAAMARYYLRGRLGEDLMSLAKQEAILKLLSGKASPNRDFFLQQLWFQLGNLLQEEFFDETARPAVKGLSFEVKHMILSTYGQNSNEDRSDRRVVAGKRRAMAGIIDKSWLVLKQVEQNGLAYTLPTSRGPRDKVYEHLVRSEDAPTGLFFVDEGNRITQVSTHTFAWGESFKYWRYAFHKNGSIDKPTRVGNQELTDDMYSVKPKL